MAALSALYREALDHLTDAQWERAVRGAMQGCRFFPVPAELIDLARSGKLNHDPEEDFDLIRAAHNHRPSLPAPPLQLPERVERAEERAERERQAEANRERVLAEIRAAGERMKQRTGTGRLGNLVQLAEERQARILAYPHRAEAERWLQEQRERNRGGVAS